MEFGMQLNWTEKTLGMKISLHSFMQMLNYSINKHLTLSSFAFTKNYFHGLANKPISAAFYHATSMLHSKNKYTHSQYRNTNERKKLNKLPLFQRVVNRFVCVPVHLQITRKVFGWEI